MFELNCLVEHDAEPVVIGAKDGRLSALCGECMRDAVTDDLGFTWLPTHTLSSVALALITR